MAWEKTFHTHLRLPVELKVRVTSTLHQFYNNVDKTVHKVMKALAYAELDPSIPESQNPRIR